MDYRSDLSENYSGMTGESPGVRLNHIAWGPIFGGTFIALGLLTLLTLFGVGMGAISFNPYAGPNAPRLATGGMIWIIISGIIAFFFGAWCTTFFAGYTTKAHGALNGLATWGVVTMITALIGVSAIGAVLGGGLSLLQSGSRVAGPVMQSAVTGLVMQPGTADMTQALSNRLAQGIKNGTIDLQAVSGIIGRVLKTGQLSDVDRQSLVSTLTTNGNLTPQQANNAVNETMQSINLVRSDFANAANQARRAASAAAFMFFFQILFNGIAALMGGLTGAYYWKNRLPGRIERELPRDMRKAA